MESSVIVPGAVLEDVTIAPGEPWGRIVKQGERLRIIDVEGRQAVDFLCYDAIDPSDRYNAANTMKLGANIFVTKGSSLWSDRAKKMMTVLEDTCGYHDTIGGCCSSEMNLLRYDKTVPRNCRDTFEEQLKKFGLTRNDIVMNLNWFMYVPVNEDGSMEIVEGRSKPGDFVDLLAERDVICIVSNCAQVYNPCNGFNPTPVRIVTYAPLCIEDQVRILSDLASRSSRVTNAPPSCHTLGRVARRCFRSPPIGGPYLKR